WAKLKPFVQQQLIYIKLAGPLRVTLEKHEASALTLAQRLTRERDPHKRHLAFLAQSLAGKLRLLDGYVHPDNFLFKSLPELTRKAALAAVPAEAAPNEPAPETPRPAVRLAYHNVAPLPEAKGRGKADDAPCGEKAGRASPLSLVTPHPAGTP